MMTLDKKYRDELQIALRLHDISGARVGEVLAEVETHVAETGEDPVEAFGSPREYAAEVAAQLDPSTGKPSKPANAMGALGTGALVFFGINFLLDGLRAGGAGVVLTQADLVGSVLTLGLILAAVLVSFRAATALTGRGVLAAVAIAIFVAALAASLAAKLLLDGVTPLFELSGWVSTGLGVVLIAGSLVLLGRAIKRGRVVDPR